jgi:hypothetical protein
MKVLSKADTATIRALAMCFLPRGGGIEHDAVDAGVLPFIDNWFAKLRPFEVLRIRALFGLFEYYIAIENLSPFARFSRAEREDQIVYLSTWENSSIYARRLAFQGVRSIITLAYDQHPGVQEQMGLGQSEEQLRAQAARLTEAAAMLSGGSAKPPSAEVATAIPRRAEARVVGGRPAAAREHEARREEQSEARREEPKHAPAPNVTDSTAKPEATPAAKKTTAKPRAKKSATAKAASKPATKKIVTKKVKATTAKAAKAQASSTATSSKTTDGNAPTSSNSHAS